MAAFRETPFAVLDRRRWRPLLDQLLGSANQKFRHAEMELMGQALHLLVERVGQLDFRTFHEQNLSQSNRPAQAQPAAGQADYSASFRILPRTPEYAANRADLTI